MGPDVGLYDGESLGDVEAGHVASVGFDLLSVVELSSASGNSGDTIGKSVANEVVEPDIFVLGWLCGLFCQGAK